MAFHLVLKVKLPMLLNSGETNLEFGYVVSGLAFLGKFGIAASFAIIYIFAGELYPTVVRAIGMGMSSMVAGSGLLLAPYLVNLVKYSMPKTTTLGRICRFTIWCSDKMFLGWYHSDPSITDNGNLDSLSRYSKYVSSWDFGFSSSTDNCWCRRLRKKFHIL